MDRWGPSEDCPKCGQPKSYGQPCDCEMNRWGPEEQEEEDG